MIIKSLTLTNFRQYKGTNEINFSTDKDKNVTVIIGKNTAGKTTLLQAFLWCLYGESSFKTKDVLNIQVRNSLYGDQTASVIVKIVLVHEGTEYIIMRQQDFLTSSLHGIRANQSQISIKSIDPTTGNASPTQYRNNEKTINQILPEDLSDYFFFDGERIESISDKRNVVDAVRGLMRIDVVNAAVEHLDPAKQKSAVGKLRKDYDLKGKESADELKKNIDIKEEKRIKAEGELKDVESEIDFYNREKVRLQKQLDECQDVRVLQTEKKHLEDKIARLETQINESRVRIVDQFNEGFFDFFARPLFKKGTEILKSAKHDMRGIPEMDEKSIDFILKRGRCICGRPLKDDPEALEAIEFERSLLPPHEIGSTIREVVETAEMLMSKQNRFSDNINKAFTSICKDENSLDITKIELTEVIDKVKKFKITNIAEMETERQRAIEILMRLNQRKGSIANEIHTCVEDIEELNKRINSLVVKSAKNELIEREIQYATTIYDWFKDEYDKSIADVKKRLKASINNIFTDMYHGERIVEIDDNYNIKLLAPVGNNKFRTDESKGLEAVKNFSFICGLVSVAREKASIKESKKEEESMRATEPYPIVMDAPFSNLDETHIKNISKILPKVAEQVILIAKDNDWELAKTTMGNKVGAYYSIEKVNNVDTHSIIRRV